MTRLSRSLERTLGPLTLADFRVLSAVAQGEGRASRLASRLAVGKPAISATVDSLCRRGLLARGGVVGDQRAVALTLTPAGADARETAEAAMSGRLAEILAVTDDRDAVLDALTGLGTAIERSRAAREGEAR